jgi:hypothetical protein
MIALEARSSGFPVAALLGAIVALAALDFVGAVLAKEWAQGRNHWLFVAGLVTFGALFTVYAIILKVAELSTVTLGWMVCLQVGLLVIDRIRYEVTLPTGKWVAIVAVLLLQVYLVLAPNNEPAKSPRDLAHGATAEGHLSGLSAGGDLQLSARLTVGQR